MANKYHVRSNSLPSGSHQSSIRIEEELSKIQTWEATSTSTSNSIGSGLSLLEDLLISLEDLLNMASTQKLISHHQGEKFVEELLDGSVRILDICGITRDTMLQIKEHVQELHSALRRRKGNSSIETSVAKYNFFIKNMKKNARKMVTSLKQMESKFGASSLLNQDQDPARVVSVLMEVIIVNMSVFQSLLSFLAGPALKSKKWLLVAKLINKGVIACEENLENSNELHSVESTLCSLVSEGSNAEKIQAAHERMEALENAIEILENGLLNLSRDILSSRAVHDAGDGLEHGSALRIHSVGDNFLDILAVRTHPPELSPNSSWLSLVSKNFCYAVDSDTVWDCFLPSDSHSIMSQSPSISNAPSKKAIYLVLSDHPVIIDESKKSFQFDRKSGKKHYMLCTRDLAISLVDDEFGIVGGYSISKSVNLYLDSLEGEVHDQVERLPTQV
ncbi:uncharacterized protein LOC130737143 [Lotus japonicus]|uniref:uncharacterized protein LOC130737143 n=1 Tax=Lotus japonicus TaxID=34305 RepID=UPI0025888004|nr:uncharacterized protein LOC130737143 [Lotus japonicus]